MIKSLKIDGQYKFVKTGLHSGIIDENISGTSSDVIKVISIFEDRQFTVRSDFYDRQRQWNANDRMLIHFFNSVICEKHFERLS